MQPPKQIALAPGISALIYSPPPFSHAPPLTTLHKTPVDAKALNTTPLETGVVSVSDDRRAVKEISSRDNVPAPLSSSTARKVVTATSSSAIVGLPKKLVKERDSRKDSLARVRDKQVGREPTSGHPSRTGISESVAGLVGSLDTKDEAAQTTMSALGSTVSSVAAARGLHCVVQ